MAVPLRGNLIDLVPKDKVGDSSFKQVIAVDYFDYTTERSDNAWVLWDGNLDESTQETLIRDFVDVIAEDINEFDDDGYYDDEY